MSLALVTIADEELVVSPASLPPIGPSPIASSVDENSIKKLGPRERALLALASNRPALKGRAGQTQQSPWSIREVSQEARLKTSKVAAHRRVTIGEWVNHAILVFAAQDAGVGIAPKAHDREPLPEVSEKTMKLVETLARHFDETGTPDGPKAATPDVFRDVEMINQALSSGAAAGADPSPVAVQGRESHETGHTEQTISELANRVRNSEMRNEKRLTELTRMMNTVTDRLQASTTGDPQVQDDPRGGREEGPAKVSNAEMVFWESIKDSDDPDAYISYLENFPNGLFASLAKRRAARNLHVEVGDTQLSGDILPPPPPSRRLPLAISVPKFDYDILNERAIENTKRRS